MSYQNVFGGENINPADLSYKLYDFTTPELIAVTSMELRWQFEALDGSRVVADKIDVLSTTAAGHFFAMPDATLVSVGEDVLWNNVGNTNFTVTDFNGSAIITVVPGTQWYIYLIDNSTPGGAWRAVQMGAATSSANAVALAGFGLRATETAKIDQNLLTNGVSGAVTLTANSRAQVYRNTGGVAVWSIDPAANLGPPPNSNNGWFIIAINNGSGNVTIDPSGGELIDGQATKVLGPAESCVVYCFGIGFTTMGYGRALSTNVVGISIDVSGTGDYTLNAAQVAAQVQDYNGTVTPPRTIIYGPGTGYWFIFNNTASPLQFKGAASDATISTVAASAFSILRSQSGAMDIAFTATSGTVTSITGVVDQIVTTPNPIVATGTIDLSVISALAPGNYGGAIVPLPPTIPTQVTTVPALNIDNRGRVRVASNVNIAINQNQILDLPALLELLMPAGVLVPYAGTVLPPVVPPTTLRAWLLCDGSVVNKTDYPRLYAAIGTTYGPATGVDPAGTFTLPDTRGRVMAGVDSGAGRLTAPAAGFGMAAVLGAASGNETRTATTAVAFSSSAVNNINFGSVGVSTTSYAMDGPDGLQGVQTGGTTVAADSHRHANVQSSGATAAINGNFNIGVSGGGTFTSSGFSDIQPTLIIRHIIKT